MTCLETENSNQLNNVNDGKSRAGLPAHISRHYGAEKSQLRIKFACRKQSNGAYCARYSVYSSCEIPIALQSDLYHWKFPSHKFTCMRRKWFSFWWIKQTFDDIKKLQFSKWKILFGLFFLSFFFFLIFFCTKGFMLVEKKWLKNGSQANRQYRIWAATMLCVILL